MKISRKLIQYFLFYVLLLSPLPLTADSSKTFETASRDQTFAFPKDHGAHVNFETEWWYYTGFLSKPGSNVFEELPQYGFQLTFFRRAEKGDSNIKQFYLAHAALSDLQKEEYIHNERVGSSVLDLAGAEVGFLNVWNNDWYAKSLLENHNLRFSLLNDSTIQYVDIELKPLTEVQLQGDSGFSKKGTCPNCGASHYLSFPKLTGIARLGVNKERNSYDALVWNDHEYMTNLLSEDQSGWDWFGLHLRNGDSLMLYQLRGRDGEESFVSGNLYKKKDGTNIRLGKRDISLIASKDWRSPKSGATYPLDWKIVVPKHNISLEMQAIFPEQELSSTALGGENQEMHYWEGAVRDKRKQAIGYLEMTGYAGPMNLQF